MNYIELINRFWIMRRSTRLSSYEADLYYFLLQESNIRGWENPFECSNGLVASTIGITEKTLIAVRQRLKDKGLISFKPGQRRSKSPVYTLLECNPDSKSTSRAKAEKSKPAAVIPTVEEVGAYCRERRNKIDAQAFVDFYTAKDWMIGKNRMKDWRAAVRTWENNCVDKYQANRTTKKTEDDTRW